MSNVPNWVATYLWSLMGLIVKGSLIHLFSAGFVISSLVPHKQDWTFLFLKPYVFLREETYHYILFVVPYSLWHSLIECLWSRQSFLPALVPSCLWCQSSFSQASQFAIITVIGRRTTSLRGFFGWRKTWKSCDKVPMRFRFLSSLMTILQTNNYILPSDTSMWPNMVHRTASLSL